MSEYSSATAGNINYIRTGNRNGSPVLLLHAIGMDLTLWDRQIEALQLHHDVIAVDLPGHGLSAGISGEPSFSKFSFAVKGLIESLQAGPVHLIGISFGSMVAQAVAIDYADLVCSLTLIGSACTFAEPVRAILKQRATFVRENGMMGVAPLSLARWITPEIASRRPDIIDRINKILYRQDPLFHAALWDMIAGLETQTALANLSVPAMVIVGDKDTSTPISAANELAAALKTKNIHIVENSSHFTNVEAPEAVNELIINFLSSQ